MVTTRIVAQKARDGLPVLRMKELYVARVASGAKIGSLSGSKVTEDGIAELERAIPGLSVTR